MKIRKRGALLLLLLLTSCKLANAPTNDVSDHLPLPIVDTPPDVRTFMGPDSAIDNAEIRLYYDALVSYVKYVDSYIDFLGTQYNLTAHRESKACQKALGTFPTLVRLPKTPPISNLSDEEAFIGLVEHIAELRKMIAKYNLEIVEKRKKVLAHCQSVIFYSNP